FDFNSVFIKPCGAMMRASANFRPFAYLLSKRPPTAQLSAGMVWNHIQSTIFADSVGLPISMAIMVLPNSSASFARTSSDSFSLVNTSTNGISLSLVVIFPGRRAFGLPPLPSGLPESLVCGKGLQIAPQALTTPLPQCDQSPGEQTPMRS